MNKSDLLKQIAETGYNVGLGAKKHMATYDIVEKVPGLIGFFSIAIGVFSLVYPILSERLMSAFLVVLGVIGVYISFYDAKKSEYENAGIALIKLFNELKRLYGDVKASAESDLDSLQKRLDEIEGRFYQTSISKQILFSEWYAHYKFFWQHQIDWIDEQKKFKFFRDKIPLTLSMVVGLPLVFLGFCGFLSAVMYLISYFFP
jgi:hypothetical protein